MAEARRRRRIGRIAVVVLGIPLLAAGGSGLWLTSHMRASLPQLEGQRTLKGLTAPVRVERDAHGVPRLAGATREDVARALGFLHGQERFFQMDLQRRRPAGELSELVGPGTVKLDRAIRVHRFRSVAQRVSKKASAEERGLIEAYTEGVNSGLAALEAPPFEYMALRLEPKPWTPEDTILVALAMYVTLQTHLIERESFLGVMHDTLPPALFEFLTPKGTAEWDAPIVGEPLGGPPVPGPDVIDRRQEVPKAVDHRGQERPVVADAWAHADSMPDPDFVLGSNNWAVSGAHTKSGVPLLADDMHLQITVPNIWYRASLVWKEAGEERQVTGVTLPGTPVMVVGSNGSVAWGFTNSEGDWADLIELEEAPNDPDSYLTPDGPRKIEHVTERIRVKGGVEETLDVEETIWGPVIDKDHRGRKRALRWVAQDEEGVNLALGRIERARTLTEAQEAANLAGAPAQNFVAADKDNHIGWTILGRIPRRVGFDGMLPGSWADGHRRWDGFLQPSEYPRVVDPPSGRIWTANSRVVDGERLQKVGFGGYDLGARAKQIRDDLLAIDKATPEDMLKVQIDDRALFLARWRDLLLAALTPEATAKDPGRAEMRGFVESWGGRASVDSVGYRLVRDFRTTLAEQVFESLTAPCKAADPRFRWTRMPFYEGPLWALVSERPLHLLDPKYKTWEEQVLAAADAVIVALTKDGLRLADQTWGRRNTSVIQHPLSRAVPSLARFLDMPQQPLPGDSNMPRAQGPDNGASERLAVSPGREAEGLFHMPVGQSGHPLSPNYADGHEAWVKGEPRPFLPGPPAHVLTLSP
ncbi:MAG: penicillin acylase family protein [Solirubrobacterales bacterium]